MEIQERNELKKLFEIETNKFTQKEGNFNCNNCKSTVKIDIWNDEYISWLENKIIDFPTKNKIKMFSDTVSILNLENQINEWTKELNIKIVSIDISANVMNDYYMDSAPPMICNTWHEYIAIIKYVP